MGNVRNIRRLLALSGGLAAIAVATMIGISLHGNKPLTPQKGGEVPAAEMTLRQVQFSEVREGRKHWDVTADRAEYDKETDLTLLHGVRFIVYGRPETGEVTVTADRAEYRQQSRDVRLIGRVQAVGDSGVSFATNEVTYYGGSALFKSPGHVKLVDGRLAVEGIGMEFSPRDRKVRLDRQVAAVVAPERTDQ